jgi:cyclopropane-fatty-acyl-phospholipid synthase
MYGMKSASSFLKTLDRLECGYVDVTLPDGKNYVFQGRNPGPSSTLVLNEWKVLTNLLVRGDSAFAEDYRRGLWDTGNLQDLLSLALANDNVLRPFLFGSKISQLTARLSYLLRTNTLAGSRRNIHAHYDLGNNFYKLWLDETMSYSAAIFDGDDTLESAQNRKYDRILSRLNGETGRLLEVGCGWGGFAERAMERGDLEVKGITISEEQHAFAQSRLGEKADIRLEDYRHQTGLYDHIVSIEMFEAVGERYWPTYFKKIGGLLAKRGKAVIQTITIRDDLFESYRKGGDVIRDYIFPGGMLPSAERFSLAAQKHGLKSEGVYMFGQDYARTLEIWLKNFEEKNDQIRRLGFDEPFMRLWRFYLAACIAGFRTGRTNVMQVELSHA